VIANAPKPIACVADQSGRGQAVLESSHMTLAMWRLCRSISWMAHCFAGQSGPDFSNTFGTLANPPIVGAVSP
jgi:hypothetical protein